MGDSSGSGPLRDVRVVELASLAPAPFAACLLADMGADVIRVDRIGPRPAFSSALLDRGKRSIAVDLKRPAGVALLLDLVAGADILIEGFRPGVTERLGVGPDECLARRPSLVYGRMTGYGQSGPMAERAGHDINYIAMSGVLSRIGRAGQPPTPPLNLVGDFGGGSMFLLFGVLCALHEAGRSGQGQVVDASMTEGSGYLMLPFFGAPEGNGATGQNRAGQGRAGQDRAGRDGEGRRGGAGRGASLLDSGAPFYDSYETADSRWVAVGAMEPQFYAALLSGLGLDAAELPPQMDPSGWPELRQTFTGRFRSRTRDEWSAIFGGTDACVTPVLELHEVPGHPQHVARRFYDDVAGSVQPGAAPRLSATPGRAGGPSPATGEHTGSILAGWLGLGEAEVDAMYRDGVVA